MKKKKEKNTYGRSCLAMILIIVLVLLFITFDYKSYDTKSDVAESNVIAEIKPIVKDIFEIGVDEKSEREAIKALRVLAEAQQRYFVHTSQLKHYASTIEELGFIGDGEGGAIQDKSVWKADANSEKLVALGKTKSEYSVKILNLNDPTCEVGYIALAIPLKENLAMYALYVNEAQKALIQALMTSAFRIFDKKTIKEIKKNNSIINKSFLDELSEDLDKAQPVHRFTLPLKINIVK